MNTPLELQMILFQNPSSCGWKSEINIHRFPSHQAGYRFGVNLFKSLCVQIWLDFFHPVAFSCLQFFTCRKMTVECSLTFRQVNLTRVWTRWNVLFFWRCKPNFFSTFLDEPLFIVSIGHHCWPLAVHDN